MKVSIVVPTLNEAAVLAGMPDHVRDSTRPRAGETIVVDGGLAPSRDRSSPRRPGDRGVAGCVFCVWRLS